MSLWWNNRKKKKIRKSLGFLNYSIFKKKILLIYYLLGESFKIIIIQMTFQNQTFMEGATINMPSLFCGKNYSFLKVRMQIFLESIDRGIWDVIHNGPFVTMIVTNNMMEEKDFSLKTTDEARRA